MGLKILHTADWHLDSPLASFDPRQRDFLNRALMSIPDRLGDLIRREGCSLALLAGDIFDGKPRRETVEALKAAFESWKIPVLLAPGNHDPASLWEEAWPENVYIFRNGLESVALPDLDCRVWGAGYQNMDCPPLLEGFHAHGPEKYRIGLLHGDPLNIGSPCCPVTNAQVEASGLHYLALGHIHAAGELRRGETLCGWPGCPMGRGWDETGEKGVYLVYLGETGEITRIPLHLPKFTQMKLDIGISPLETLRDHLPGGGSSDFYRITLEGEGNIDLAEIHDALEEFPNLTLRDRTCKPLDLWDCAGEDSLEGALFGGFYGAIQTAQGRDREQIELAARICRALLDGREVKL